jgi:hypothetical protein
MIPLVVDYLRSGKTLEQLEQEHHVVHRIRNGKVSLNYHHIDADKGDPLANQCRGLILREGTWDVVAYPFDRFFNLGEPHADEIDLRKTVFMPEKMDGTLLIVYRDDGKWMVGTRMDPEAATVSHAGKTFRDMAEEAAVAMGFRSFENFGNYLASYASTWEEGSTFMLELCSPENQIVCQYADRRMWLLGCRSGGPTFKEFRIILHDFNPPVVSAASIQDLVNLVETRPALENEGVVLVDYSDPHHVKRVKIKSSSYREFHHMLDRDRTRSWDWRMHAPWTSLVGIITKGEQEQLLEVCSPHVRRQILCVQQRLNLLFAMTWAMYRSLEHIDDMREFAAKAKLHPWPDALFSLKRGKSGDLLEIAARTRPRLLVRILELESKPCSDQVDWQPMTEDAIKDAVAWYRHLVGQIGGKP